MATPLPSGTAVGTGAKGGILVVQKDGSVKEVFQSSTTQEVATKLPTSTKRSGSGSSSVGGNQLTLTPEEAIKQDVAEIQRQRTGGNQLTPAQLATSSQRQGFSGTVEVYNRVGKVNNLSERRYYQEGREEYVDQKPKYGEGKVTNVTFEKDKSGRLKGIREERTTEQTQDTQEEIRAPTREELLAEGTGGVYFTKKEAEARGYTSVNAVGQPTASGRSISFAESLLGQEPGSSGTVYVADKQLNIKPASRASIIFEPIVNTYVKANSYVSSKIPTFEESTTKLTQARDFIVSKTDNNILNSLRRQDAQMFAESKKNPVNQFLGGVGRGIYEDIQQKPLKNIVVFGVGSIIGGGLRVVGLGVKAVGGATAVAVTEGVIGTAGFAFGGAYAYNLGREVIQTPGAEEKGKIVGVSLKDAGVFYGGFRTGQKGFNVAYDVIRTRGLTKVETVNVVAPEYFQGQNYPSVRSGTRAGTLQKEFFKPALPTETTRAPRGFSASAEPLPTQTKILPGTSEAPGLFSAPKVSPAFLRIAGESSQTAIVTGEGILSGGNPTATRVRFNNLDFTPGINKNTRLPTGFYNKQFLEKQRGTGRTFIPGAKTEKEAITSADSTVIQVRKKYYFNFEGRRVVIPEYEIVEGLKAPKITSIKIKDVVAESSSSRIRPSRGTIPFVFSVGSSSSSSISRFFSSIGSSVSSKLSSSKSISSSRSSVSSSILSSSSRASSSSSRLFSSSRASASSSRSGSGSSTGRSSFDGSSSGPSRQSKSYLPKRSQGVLGFNVFVRRRGKFKPVGLNLSLQRAYDVGERVTQRGLSQSFKVRAVQGTGTPFRTPKGYYAKTSKREGIIFIEQSKSKINTPSEKGLLAFARIGRRR